ncbi:hypothetical protein GZL_05973 [Streptomyces sp. 769]|nr:hypothetical protein GZL_05973 [Streptomyces sp. 769]
MGGEHRAASPAHPLERAVEEVMSGRVKAVRMRAVHGRNHMSEIDERRIAELAERPARVLGGGTEAAARQEARRVLEWQAGMRGLGRGEGGGEGCRSS